MAYIGNVPAEKYTALTQQTFSSPTGTSFTLSQAVTNSVDIDLYIDNVKQDPTTYSVSGTALTTSTIASPSTMYCIFNGRTTETVNPPDDSVGLSQIASGTDGNLITFDASGNPAYVATGTDGQVLTSTGAGSAPAFEALPASGSWVLIGTSVASASASLDQTGLSATYEHYAIILSDIIPATNGEEPRLRLGDSSGFDTGASDYDYHTQYLLDSSTSYAAQVSSGASYIKIGPNVGSASGEGMTATIFLGRPSRAAVGPQVHGWHTSVRDDTNTQSGAFYGRRIASIALDRVQFLFSSGAVAQGRMSVYGIAHA